MPAALDSSRNGSTIRGGNEQARPRITKPLVYSGSLDSYTHNDLTPIIGREYKGLQVADLLKANDSDGLITDLAVTSMETPFEPHLPTIPAVYSCPERTYTDEAFS